MRSISGVVALLLYTVAYFGIGPFVTDYSFYVVFFPAFFDWF